MKNKLLAVFGLLMTSLVASSIAFAEKLEGHEYDLVIPMKQGEKNIFFVTKKLGNTKWLGYVDGKSAHLFTKAKGMNKVWGMDVAHKNNFLFEPEKKKFCRTFRYLLALDCENWRIRTLGYAAFENYFATGEVLASSNQLMDWEFAAPDTGADKMLQFGCILIENSK